MQEPNGQFQTISHTANSCFNLKRAIELSTQLQIAAQFPPSSVCMAAISAMEHVDRALDSFNYMVFSQLVDDFEKVYLFSQFDDELVNKAKLKSENKSLQCKFQKLLVAARDMVVPSDGLVKKYKVQSPQIEEQREEVGISTIVRHKQEED